MNADHVFAKNIRLKRNPRNAKKPKLLNARLFALEFPETFYLPSDSAIKKVKPGDYVKLAIQLGEKPGERFWVKVAGFEGRKWFGEVANDLVFYEYPLGDSVQFYRKNIYDVEYA